MRVQAQLSTLACPLLLLMGSVTSAYHNAHVLPSFFKVDISRLAGVLIMLLSLIGITAVVVLEQTQQFFYSSPFAGFIVCDDFKLLVPIQVVLTISVGYVIALFISRSLRRRNVQLQKVSEASSVPNGRIEQRDVKPEGHCPDRVEQDRSLRVSKGFKINVTKHPALLLRPRRSRRGKLPQVRAGPIRSCSRCASPPL